MKGTTEEEASILITYNEVETVVTASDQGTFEYDYTTPLPIGTTITFYAKKYNDLLYHTKTIQIIYPGELVIDDATKMIVFELSPISLNPILCPKKESIIIHVTDTRVNSTNWRLYATLEKELNALRIQLAEQTKDAELMKERAVIEKEREMISKIEELRNTIDTLKEERYNLQLELSNLKK